MAALLSLPIKNYRQLIDRVEPPLCFGKFQLRLGQYHQLIDGTDCTPTVWMTGPTFDLDTMHRKCCFQATWLVVMLRKRTVSYLNAHQTLTI